MNDAADKKCAQCDYDFTSGQKGTRIPRIVVDDDNIIRRSSQSGPETAPVLADDGSVLRRTPERGRPMLVAVVALTLFVFGFVAFIFLSADSDVGSSRGPAPIDLPEIAPIQIPALVDEGREFDRASCTRTLARSLESLVRAQAKEKPLNDLFARFTSFGVNSFEYRTLVKIFTDFDIHSALVSGEVLKAVRIAEREATSACRERYGE